MATTKTFETQFNIGAKFTGKSQVAQAESALSRLGRHARDTASRMRASFAGTFAGVFGGQAAFAAASKALHGIVDITKQAMDAAEEQQKVEDHLGLTLERNAKRWGMSTEQIKLQQQAIIAMGDSLSKLGLDGETAVAMFDELTRSIDPRALNNYKKGFADFLITQKGVNASQEDAIALGQELSKLIEFSMPKSLKNYKGVTASMIEEYKKLDTVEERRIWVLKNLAKETGALEAAMATAEGQIVKRKNLFEDLMEAWGKPWIEFRQQISEGMVTLFQQIKPHLDRLAKELDPILKQIGEDFKKWVASPEAVAAFQKLGEVIKFVTAHWKEFAIAIAAIGGFVTVAAVLGTVAFAIGALVSPIGLVVVAAAGLVAAGVAIWMNWETIATKAQELWGVITTAWTAGIEQIKQFDIIGVFQAWVPVAQWVWDNVLQPIINFFWNLAAPLREAVESLYGIITKPFTDAYNYITGLFSGIGTQTFTQQAAPIPGGAGTQGEAARRATEAAGVSGWGTPMTPKIGTAGGQIKPGSLGGVLAGHEKTFEEAGRRHGVDPVLLASIAEFETGHGKSYSATHRRNIAGIMDGKRHRVYGSVEEGIEAQAALIKRGYISQGRTTIPQIGAKYSPPGASNDPHGTNWQWPGSVQKEYNRIKASAPTAAGSNQNVTVSPNITVNGVAPGKEHMVGQEVAKAMRDPVSQGLDDLKKMRAQESRLGYV